MGFFAVITPAIRIEACSHTQHQSSNHLAKYPTIHREAGHLSNTDIKVKFCLRVKSPEHLFNSELFEDLSKRGGSGCKEGNTYIMMNLRKLDTAKRVVQ